MNFLKISVVLVATIQGGHAFSQEPEWYAKDSTKRLKELVEQFRVNYEMVTSQKRAFVCKGIRLETGSNKFSAKDVYFVGYFNKDLKLYANSYLGESVATNRAIERWDQYLYYKSTLHRRWGPYSADKRESLQKEKEIKHADRLFVKFSPLDMTLSLEGNAFVGGPSKCDRWLTTGKLIECRYEENRDITHVIQNTDAQRPFQVSFLWSKKAGYLPTRTQYDLVSLDGNGNVTTVRPISLVKSQWQKRGDVSLPSKIEIVRLRKMRTHREMTLSIKYRLGDEIPPELLIEPDLADWREPIRILFDEDWQRSGKRLPAAIP